MGLLLFVVAQIGLYGLVWYLVSTYAVTDTRSYLGGVLHVVTIAVIGFWTPRLFVYFRQRGWVADPRMWWSRIHFAVNHDFVVPPSGWDVDVVRMQMVRSRDQGTLSICLALVGVHLHVWLLIDPKEAAAYRAGREQAREAYIAALPSPMQHAVREMMKTVPLDANVVVTAPLRQPDMDDEDDETDSKPSGGVH